jgi:DNA-binding beta-propeller fold protein YncE
MNANTCSTRLLFLIAILCFGNSHAFTLEYEAASDRVFSRPHDVVLSPDKSLLYVADNENDRIAILDPERLKLMGVFGEGEVTGPHDVAFDDSGRLLVADTGGDRIAIYRVYGNQAKLVDSLTTSLSRPEGVVMHPNGMVYAAGTNYGNIIAYEKGKVVHELGGLSAPHDVTVAPDRTLWIADAGNNRLVNVSEDLKIIRVLEGAPYHFNGPRYLDFDAAGRLYVADKYNHQVKVLAPDLSPLLTLGKTHSTFGPGRFNRPEGVAIHGDRVWFADTYNDRIVRYRIVE